MSRSRLSSVIVGLCLGLALTSCEETAAPETVERIRAIKPYYVVEPAGGDVRRYSGTVAATNTSSLAFAVSGTVATVDVEIGARVSRGDVLATLDRTPFDLDMQAATAELEAKRAELVQARDDLARQRELFEKGWVAKAALEKAQALAETAAEALNLAQSRLGLVDRDLSKSTLRAPFDGVIVSRDLEPFTEISRGEPVLRLDSEGSMEVNISVSDAVVERIVAGAPVTIKASTVSGCGCEGRITEIGAQAGTANTVPVTAVVTRSAAGLIPGMGVEVGVALQQDEIARGYLVPIQSIAPGDDAAQGYVFKFDPDSGVVRRTPISGSSVVDGNLVGVSEGVAAGDIVAAAGVSFLRDGQKVTLLQR